MPATYPSGAKSFTTKVDGPTQTIFAAHINDAQDEIVAIESALATNGVAHALKPSTAGGQDLGTAGLPWGIARANGLQFVDATTLTLATDTITAIHSYHAIDTEGAAASDNCATITPGTGVAAGFILVLRAANVARVVTMKDGTGNLLLNGDYALSTTDATITLIYDGTNWRELARSVTTSATPVVTLLKANSGTDTDAAAKNVDTIATGALTAKDSLLVIVTCSEATQAVARLDLYTTTDSQNVARLTTGGTMGAGVALLAKAIISPDPAAATTYLGLVEGFTTGGGVSELLRTTSLTAWTTGFTLALRHGGVTAGGTLTWKWAVYKIAGQ